MTLPISLRRVLSWLRLGRSPRQVQPRIDGSAVYRSRETVRRLPVPPPAALPAVPAPTDPPPAGDLTRFEETRRIDRAAQRRVPVAPDDKFGPAGAPRTRGGSQVYGTDGGNGDEFDRNSGNHHRDRWLP